MTTQISERLKRIENPKISYHPEWLRRNRHDPFNTPPIYVEISPVGMCNHRCTFCAPEMLGYPNRSLDVAVLAQRLKEMRLMSEEDSNGLGVSSIQYAGEGEPTLHKDLAKIFAITRENGIDVAMLTNGTGLTESLSRQIIPLVNGWLQTSINAGCAETYAKIHRTTPKHWDLVWKNLAQAVEIKQKLGAKDCELGANMTVLVDESRENNGSIIPANWPEIEMLVARGRETGLDYVSLKPYSQHPYSQATAKHYGKMSYAAIMTGIEKLGLELANRYNSDSFEVVLRDSRFREYEQLNSDRGYQVCLATPTVWSYIQSDGIWISCSAHWTNPQFHLGNINTQTVQEIWYGERRRQHLKYVLEELDITECRKTCHPDKENVRLTNLKNMPDKEFESELVRLEALPKPKNWKFI